jgi:hypothetical protein
MLLFEGPASASVIKSELKEFSIPFCENSCNAKLQNTILEADW